MDKNEVIKHTKSNFFDKELYIANSIDALNILHKMCIGIPKFDDTHKQKEIQKAKKKILKELSNYIFCDIFLKVEKIDTIQGSIKFAGYLVGNNSKNPDIYIDIDYIKKEFILYKDDIKERDLAFNSINDYILICV